MEFLEDIPDVMQQITIKLKVEDLDKLREYADKKGATRSATTSGKQYPNTWKITINEEIYYQLLFW